MDKSTPKGISSRGTEAWSLDKDGNLQNPFTDPANLPPMRALDALNLGAASFLPPMPSLRPGATQTNPETLSYYSRPDIDLDTIFRLGFLGDPKSQSASGFGSEALLEMEKQFRQKYSKNIGITGGDRPNIGFLSTPAIKSDRNIWVIDMGVPMLNPKLARFIEETSALHPRVQKKFALDLFLQKNFAEIAGISEFPQQGKFESSLARPIRTNRITNKDMRMLNVLVDPVARQKYHDNTELENDFNTFKIRTINFRQDQGMVFGAGLASLGLLGAKWVGAKVPGGLFGKGFLISGSAMSGRYLGAVYGRQEAEDFFDQSVRRALRVLENAPKQQP